MAFDISLSKFAIVVLSVVWEQCLGIRVTHETIDTASLSSPLVTCGHGCKRGILPDGLAWSCSIQTVFSIVLTESTILLTLGGIVQLRGRLWHLGVVKVVPSCLSELARFSLIWGLGISHLTHTSAGLGALADSCLVHRLEGVVSWHSSVVQIGLSSVRFAHTWLACLTIVLIVTSLFWCHYRFLINNLFLLITDRRGFGVLGFWGFGFRV